MRERNHTMNTTRNQLYSISKAWEGGGGGGVESWVQQ